MGVKFLKVQRIPWCLQLMGNHMISCVHMRGAERAAATAEAEAESSIKLIKCDGVVKIYERPINVSQVLVEYPKHLICRSDSFYIGQKIPALSLSDQLQLGHKYFLLPKHYFQTVLSFVTITSFVNDYNNQLQSRSITTNSILKKAATCQAFDIQKSPSGCLRIRVSDEFISELMEEGNIKHDSKITRSKVCTTPQLLKDYNLLVASRHWKPKLETIREKEKRKVLSSFGMKSRKKSHSKRIQKTCPSHKSSDHPLLPTSSKPSSKAKIKIRLRK